MRALTVVALVLLAIAILASPGRAQSGHAEHHDWYKDLRQPGTGYSCCNALTSTGEGDCRPVRGFLHDDGQWRAIVEGRAVRIPAEKIIEQSAPDGNSHLCMSPAGTVYCFIRGLPKG